LLTILAEAIYGQSDGRGEGPLASPLYPPVRRAPPVRSVFGVRGSKSGLHPGVRVELTENRRFVMEIAGLLRDQDMPDAINTQMPCRHPSAVERRFQTLPPASWNGEVG
jgi:hypothetical protein